MNRVKIVIESAVIDDATEFFIDTVIANVPAADAVRTDISVNVERE